MEGGAALAGDGGGGAKKIGLASQFPLRFSMTLTVTRHDATCAAALDHCYHTKH